MAVTHLGRVRDLLILMQQKLSKDETALLTVTGGSPAAELYILNHKTNEMQTIKEFQSIREFNRWAAGNLEITMSEFI